MDTATQAPQGATLASRLAQAPLPVEQALRHAVQLAEALRSVHDAGQICGVLDSGRILLSSSHALIEPAGADFTPYAAPELFAGAQPDPRTDIFAFGAIVYHLLTGRQPFAGNTPAEIAQAAREQSPSPLGMVNDGSAAVAADAYPGLERIVMRCLEKNPDQRWQRMQAICMELKLLKIAARRTDPGVNARRDRAEEELRAQVARVEHAFAARVGACDQSVTELQRAAAETRDHLKLSAAAQASMLQSMQSLEQSLAAVREMAARLEAGLAESSRTTACVEEALSGQLAAIEEQIGSHAHSIDALHTGMAQTDDLLERVVESFDSLQSFVLEHADEKPSA